MPFVAKKTGPYRWGSDEFLNNVRMINGFLNQYGFTLQAQAGIIGNIIAESGVNPWRWNSDTSEPSRAYGLFQYWPGSGYTNNATAQTYLGYGPSLSVSEPTPGETPDDGWAQMLTLMEDTLGKWISTLWRRGWNKDQYPRQYETTMNILSTWGGADGKLSLSEYAQITDAFDAGCAFFAAYEGAEVWRMYGRGDNANDILPRLSLDVPPEPPGTIVTEKTKWIYYIRPLWWQMLNNRR